MPLSAEQINKLKVTLASEGWTEVMKPALLGRSKEALKALVLTIPEREKQGGEFRLVDDSGLRHAIREIEWMLAVWHNEIAAYDHNQRLDELERNSQPRPAGPVGG